MPPQLAGPTLVAPTPPPAISGGTLLATRDGKLVVASDPDRDLLYVVSVAERSVKRVLSLGAGEEPGRLVEDSAGRVHVVLRGAGSIATFKPADMAESMRTRRSVCDLPRGIAYDAKRDQLHVACADGKLVSLAADPSGEVERSVDLGRDLRDVVVHDGTVFVTRFRSAELLELDADGEVVERSLPPVAKRVIDTPMFDGVPPSELPNGPNVCTVKQPAGAPALVRQMLTASPAVAWRAVEAPSGVLMLHQQEDDNEIGVMPGGYGSNAVGCGRAIVRSAVSMLSPGQDTRSGTLARASLAVDLAFSPDGDTIAVAAPGGWASAGVQVMLLSSSQLRSEDAKSAFDGQCADDSSTVVTGVNDQATAVAFPSERMLAVQTREPASVSFVDTRTGVVLNRVDLGQTSRFDTGHTIFHFTTFAGLACASCHAEGGDDGHVWNFAGAGPRRTQSLRGGILGSEPFHWSGDMADLNTLVREVFVDRMGGVPQSDTRVGALAAWMFALQAPPPPRSAND
ncbi:MAG TPA: hypothetical protein VJR89_43910, partial [Polyangiales bacterium]|nr:hypothetical protein [Polyangiales bacterium]